MARKAKLIKIEGSFEDVVKCVTMDANKNKKKIKKHKKSNN